MRRLATAGSALKLRQLSPSTDSTTCRRPSSASPATIRRCPCLGSSMTIFRASHASLMRYATRSPNSFTHPELKGTSMTICRASHASLMRYATRSPNSFTHPAMNGGRMTTFNLPDLGEGLAEAEIVRWHVKLGDQVKVDQPMLAVETAKAVVEVPSPYSVSYTRLMLRPN